MNITKLTTACVIVGAMTLTACAREQQPIVRGPQDGQLTEDDFYDEEGDLNVNITKADFIDDFYALDSVGRADNCMLFESITFDDAMFDLWFDTMWDAGYSGDQISNSYEALAEVCP